MPHRFGHRSRLVRLLAAVLAAVLFLSAAALPARAASGALPALRVGCVPDPGFLELDDDGQARGYLAEYLTNIAQRAGFSIEYVPFGNLREMFSALDRGEIDLIPNCPETEERRKDYLFCGRETGAVNDALIVRQDDDRYDYGDVNAVSGMTVAVIEGSTTTELFQNWLDENCLVCKKLECGTIEELLDAVRSGRADATLYGDGIAEDFRTVVSFASSPFYIVMRRDSAGLKRTLDTAMNEISSENMLYEVQLYHKYFGEGKSGTQAFSRSEKDYLASHGSLTVAVLKNDSPYYSAARGGCGILPDYYAQVSEKTGISFRFRAYQTQEEAIAAVKKGEADILGLYSAGILSAYNEGLRLTVPFTTVSAIMITHSGTELSDVHLVAVKARNKGLIQEKKVLDDSVKLVGCDNAAACFSALRRRRVDAVICGMPSATWLLNQTNSSAYGISPVSLLNYELCGAVLPENRTLCSLLNKVNAGLAGGMDGVIERNTLQADSLLTFISRIPPVMIMLTTGILLAMIISLAWALILLRRRQQERAAVLAAQAETERRRVQVEAIEKNAEERNRFFSNISHDMRTPLNGIIGFADLAEKEAVSEKARDYLAKIKLSGNLLLSLINDTLTISKMSSGKLVLKPEPVGTDDITRALTASIAPAAEKKGVSFLVDDAGLRRRTILADKLNLQKLFLNLLSNAVKFTPPGGHIRFTVRDDPAGAADPDIVATVEDDGIGMSEEYQAHLFEPFTQENRPGYEAVGTGLGLSIVRQLADLMGGTIEVRSEPDRGTTFTVRLHFPETAEAGAASAALPPDTAALRGKRVLLCEDNPLNREIACALLREKGMEPTAAENGGEGLRRFTASAAGQFSLILMDLRMPVMDGYETAAAIRALDRADAKTVPILAMTADAFEDDVQKCLSVGMNGHISKPVEPNSLYRAMLSVLSPASSGN